jgi:hypothetical protein
MQRVLLLLNPKRIGKDVVALRLLPEIVELDQLAHGPGPHLLALRIQCCQPLTTSFRAYPAKNVAGQVKQGKMCNS